MRAIPLQDALEEAIQRLESGAGLEEVLEAYPGQAAELRPLLEAAMLASSLRAEIHVPRNAELRSRARFLQAASIPRRKPFRAFLRTSWSMASILVVLALLLTGTGLASAQSLPGDRLYPVKRAAEQARLNLVQDPAQRLQLTAGYDHERVDEVEALLTRDQARPVELEFAGFLSRQDERSPWQVGGIPLILPAGLPNQADLKPGLYVDVHGTPAPGGKVLVESIRVRIEQVSGPLQKVEPGTWKVDQLNLNLTEDTHISGAPRVGEEVEAEVTRRMDGSLEATSLVISGAQAESTPTAARSVSPQGEQPEATDRTPSHPEVTATSSRSGDAGVETTPTPGTSQSEKESRSQSEQPASSPAPGEGSQSSPEPEHSVRD